MTLERDNESRVTDQAGAWLATLLEGNDQRTAFFQWLHESPRHVEEFLWILAHAQDIAALKAEQRGRIEQLAGALGVPDLASPNVVPLTGTMPVPIKTTAIGREQPAASANAESQTASDGTTPRHDSMQTRTRWWRWFGAAAGISLVILGIWLTMAERSRTYSTAIGEQRAVELDDGSIVHLNTGTTVSVDFTDRARDIRLHQGEALFKIERDPERPFRVHAAGTIVQAVGTQFNVHARSAKLHVAVIEGIVQISPEAAGSIAVPALSEERASSSPRATKERLRPKPVLLVAGERAVVSPGGEVVERAAANLVKTTAWRQRRLVFEGDTLGEIAAEFNRYNTTPKLRVIGQAAFDQHFSGTFDADAPEVVALALEADPTLIVEWRGGEIVIRRRESARETIIHK